MWLILAGVDGDEIPYGQSEYAHGRREVCIAIGRIAILEHGSLEFVGVQCAISVSVARDETFHCLDSHLRTAVAVGEGN